MPLPGARMPVLQHHVELQASFESGSHTFLLSEWKYLQSHWGGMEGLEQNCEVV
jgi:hypothetical protein